MSRLNSVSRAVSRKINRRGFWERGAAGDDTETPNASRGWRMGRGCPLPSRLGGLRSVVSSPSGVRGRAPTENGFGALYSCQKAPRSNHFEYFEVHVFSLESSVISTNYHFKNFRGGGEPPPLKYGPVCECLSDSSSSIRLFFDEREIQYVAMIELNGLQFQQGEFLKSFRLENITNVQVRSDNANHPGRSSPKGSYNFRNGTERRNGTTASSSHFTRIGL